MALFSPLPMPMVACPECQRQISSAAPSCPQCGYPMGVSNAPVAAGGLPLAMGAPPGREAVVWQGTPSLKAILGTLVGTALFAVALPVVAYFLFGVLAGGPERAPSEARTLALLLVGGVVLGCLVQAAWRIAFLKSHHYKVTNQRVVIESGVLSRTIEELDLRTVDDIQFRQSFFERIVGVGSITLISSDKMVARTLLSGIERPRDLREVIRTQAYQATRGQLFTRST